MQPGQLTHVQAPSMGLPSSSRAPRGGIGGHFVLGQAEPRPAAPRCPSLNSELDHRTSALVLGSLQSPCTLRPTHSPARVELTTPGLDTRTVPCPCHLFPGGGLLAKGTLLL